MWMSEAWSVMAWLIRTSTRRTIGASSRTSFMVLRRSSSRAALVAAGLGAYMLRLCVLAVVLIDRGR